MLEWRQGELADHAAAHSGRFIVTCHGWSASNWLACALNAHPRITCAHSSAAIIADDPGQFEGQGLKRSIPALRRGYVQRQTRPIAEVYDEIERARPAAFVGTVHTYRLRDLPVQAARFDHGGERYPVVNLVRHPVDLVVSGYGQFRDLFPIDLNEFAWTLRKIVDGGLDIVEDVCARHGKQPGGFDEVCFFGACVVLGSLRLDLDARDTILAGPPGPWDYRGCVGMEDLTRDSAELANLIETLTGRTDLADPPYLERIAALGRVNRHNRKAPAGRAARWAALAPWQKEGFRRFLDRFDLRGAYSDMGYDFDFMEG